MLDKENLEDDLEFCQLEATATKKDLSEIIAQNEAELMANFSEPIRETIDRAKKKLRGLVIWRQIYKDLTQFGTSSNLLISKTMYKKNLTSIINSKRRRIRYETVIKEKKLARVFNPDKPFLQTWNMLMFLLLIYVFIGTPWIIAFEEVEIGSPLFLAELFVDFLFFCDILVTMNSAYYDQEVLVRDRKKIVLNYATGLFVIDLISIFPFFLFEDSSASGSNSLVRMIRIFKVVRILRTSKLIKIINHLLSSERFRKIVIFFKKFRGISWLFGGLLLILTMTHFMACIWFLAAKIELFEPSTWVVRHGYMEQAKTEQYLAAFYWSFTTLTTVGFGDISARTGVEMLICILWMIFGIIIYSFIVGSITTMLHSLDIKRKNLLEKRRQIQEFATDLRLCRQTTQKMLKSVKHFEGTLPMDEDSIVEIMNYFTKDFQKELCLKMHEGAASRLQFFSSQEVAFIISVVPRLVYSKVKSDMTIYNKNEVADGVYFIVEGRINYLTDHMREEDCEEDAVAFKTLFKGSYFGEYEVIKDQRRWFSVITETLTTLLIMPNHVFKLVNKRFPKTAREISLQAESKHKRDLEAKLEMDKALHEIAATKINKVFNHAGHSQVPDTQESNKRKRKTTAETGSCIRNSRLSPQDVKNNESAVSNYQQLIGLRDKLDIMRESIDQLIANYPID